MRHVRTCDQFDQALSDSRFDLIYYYGHGRGDQLASCLVFEDSAEQLIEKPFASVADAVCRRDEDERPVLIYINCCQGDAGGMLGAGHQLCQAAPCVITNRTVAKIDTARRQAREFWKVLLKQAQPPHVAASVLYQQPDAIGVSRNEVHWFTPVVHAHYSSWSAQPITDDHEIPEDWNLNLDRVAQYSELTHRIRVLRRERTRRAIAFIWFGEVGQGMRLFHERLEVKLNEDIGDDRVKTWHPRWPDSLGHKDFKDIAATEWKDCLTETFHVSQIKDIAARLRAEARHEKVILLRFPHVEQSWLDRMNPRELRGYLRWWDDHVLQEIPDEDRLFVLTFSFETQHVKKFSA